MIKTDYHLHSSFSGDSEADMEEMIKHAIDLGLKEICFTEHMDYDFPISEETPAGCFELNVDSYLYDLLTIRDKYVKDITVKFGMELGLQPQTAKMNYAAAAGQQFDFIIGSIHVVDGMDVYKDSDYFKGKTDEEAYRRYFDAMYENLKLFSDFDVVGHLDYVVRYGQAKDANYSYAKYSDILDKILRQILEMGKGIELNTSAIRAGLKEFNPCMDILKRYKELGGEIITVGSDAHRVENMGERFDLAEKVLKDAGFEYYTTFSSRRPIQNRI